MVSEDDLYKDLLLAEYYALKRGKSYCHVERLELRQSDEFGGSGNIAFIELVLSSSEEPGYLCLTFNGVYNLRLTPPARMVISMITLEISPVGDFQWEGIYYQIKETENETISFLCRDFKAELK